MKRRYAAMVLGLVLTVSSMNVYAAADTAAGADAVSDVADESDAAADTDAGADSTADTLENDETQAEEVVGEVKSVEEDSITIEVGTLVDEENPGDKTEEELPADADTEETETSDTQEQNTDAEDAEQPDAEQPDVEQPDVEQPDAEQPQPNAEQPDAEQPYEPIVLNLTGEEKTVAVTEDTIIVRELQPGMNDAEAPAESPEKPADATDANADTETEADTEKNDDAAPTAAADSEDADTENVDGADDAAADEDTTGKAADDMTPDGEDIDESFLIAEIPTEEIELTDIAEGDIVVITLDEDGNAAMITVKSHIEDETEIPADDAMMEDTENTADAEKDSADSTDTDTSNADDAAPDAAAE